MVLYQFFVAMGILLGPIIAAAGDLLGIMSFTNDAVAGLMMVLWGVLLEVAILIMIPENISELEEQAGLTPEEIREPSPAEAMLQDYLHEFRRDRFQHLQGKGWSNGLALFATLLVSAGIRMMQRLLWESGAVIAVQKDFGWTSSQARYMYMTVVIGQASAQLFFSNFFAGKYSDMTLLRSLELLQLGGAVLMFPLPSCMSIPQWARVAQFMVASIIAYCSNALWSGVISSFCVKRTIQGPFSSQNLMVLNQAAIFVGIAFGCIISRAVEDLNPGVTSLAAVLLMGAVLQLFISLVSISNISLDLVVLPLAIITGVGVAIGALSTQLGGTGAANVFTWHLVGMGLAWPFLGMWGYWSYKADALEGTYANRKYHMMCMVPLLVLTIAGYSAIFAAHHANGEGQFGGLEIKNGLPSLSRGFARFAHVVVGYFVVLGTLAQVPAGLWKRQALVSYGERVAEWHKTFGQFLLLGGLLAVGIGTWIEFNDSGQWPIWLRIGITACLAGLATVIGM